MQYMLDEAMKAMHEASVQQIRQLRSGLVAWSELHSKMLEGLPEHYARRAELIEELQQLQADINRALSVK